MQDQVEPDWTGSGQDIDHIFAETSRSGLRKFFRPQIDPRLRPAADAVDVDAVDTDAGTRLLGGVLRAGGVTQAQATCRRLVGTRLLGGVLRAGV